MAVKLSKGRKKSLLKLPISFFDRYLPTVNGDYLPTFEFDLGDQEISYDGSEFKGYQKQIEER